MLGTYDKTGTKATYIPIERGDSLQHDCKRAGTYAVLGRRRARVMREELREGSALFSILAYLPAQASFGLADDLRRRTSGGASAALMLSHWERLQVTNFFPCWDCCSGLTVLRKQDYTHGIRVIQSTDLMSKISSMHLMSSALA